MKRLGIVAVGLVLVVGSFAGGTVGDQPEAHECN